MLVAIIILLLGAIGVLGGGGFIVYSSYTTSKAEINELVLDQQDHFKDSQAVVDDIITALKTDDFNFAEPEEDILLKKESDATFAQFNLETEFDTPEVLGIEESGPIQKIRELSSLSRELKVISEDIIATSNKINDTYSSMMITYQISNPSDLVDRSKNYAEQIKTIAEYNIEMYRIDIQSLIFIYDFFVAIAVATEDPTNETQLQRLDEIIANVDALQSSYKAIDVSNLPEYYREEYQLGKDEYPSFKRSLEEIVQSIRDFDAQSFENEVETLFLSNYIEADKGVVREVSFWTDDNSIVKTQTLLNEWENYKDTL